MPDLTIPGIAVRQMSGGGGAPGAALRYLGSFTSADVGNPQTVSGVPIGPAAPDRLLIMCIQNGSANPTALSALSISPNAGSPKPGYRVVEQQVGGQSGFAAIWQAQVPDGTVADFQMIFAASPGDGQLLSVYSVGTAGMNSATATGASSVRVTGTNNAIVDIASSAGGFVIACAACLDSNARGAVWGGDATFIERYDDKPATAAIEAAVADASNVAAHPGDLTVAVGFQNVAAIVLAAASWR